MKRTIRILSILQVILGAWLIGFVAHGQPVPTETALFLGHWAGEIKLPQANLEIRLDLSKAADQTLSGTLDIPVQKLRDFPVSSLQIQGRSITFKLAGIPGDPTFEGALSEGDPQITGQFKQGGQTLPFRLAPNSKPAPTSAQTPARGIPGTGFVGSWQGSLAVAPGVQLRLLLELTNSPQGILGATLTSLDQGNSRIPCVAATNEINALQLALPSIRGSYIGVLSPDGSELKGQWKQTAIPLSLTFKRLATTPNLQRPQDPVKPYPYLEEEVQVTNSGTGILLAGTFTRPKNPGPHPAVVLITGSGPQDRDEAIMGHRPFLVLADHLTRAGIAVLRLDDRGVAKSAGNFATATHKDFVTDTLSAVEWLRARKEVDPSRIGLIGHSEGGVVGPLAAVEAPDRIAFLVLLAGVGVPVDQLLVRQNLDLGRVVGVSEDLLAKSSATQKEVLALLKSSVPNEDLKPKVRQLLNQQVAGFSPDQRNAMGVTDRLLEAQVQQLTSPWFQKLIQYDPASTLKRVRCPLLALNGSKDLQVAAHPNLSAIRDATTASGNTTVEVQELPGLNHLFQSCSSGAPSEYDQIDETFNPAALKKLTQWIQQQCRMTP